MPEWESGVLTTSPQRHLFTENNYIFQIIAGFALFPKRFVVFLSHKDLASLFCYQ